MSTTEIMQQIDTLPLKDQQGIFALMAKKVASMSEAGSMQWLGKKLSFEEACNVVFRENRELLSALAK